MQQKRGRFYSGGRGRRIKIITAFIALLILVAIAAIPLVFPLDSGGGSAITEANPCLAGEWVNKTDTPFKSGRGEAVVGTDDYIYVARCWSNISASLFYRYNPDNDSWTKITGLQKGAFRTGTALAWDNGNYIYALLGARYFYKINSHYYPENRYLFYRYNISSDTWDPPLTLNNTPYSQGAGDAITWCNYDNKSYIYAMMGKSTPSHGGIHYGYLARYYPDSDKWENLTFNPNWTCTDDGSSLVWTGGKYLYALQGEIDEKNGSKNNNFSRYDIDNDKWEDRANIPEGSCGVGDGGSILWIGNWVEECANFIYALGGGCASDTDGDRREEPGYNFSAYNISNNSWEPGTPIPYPVGEFVGNRLGFAKGHIYYWQGNKNYTKHPEYGDGKAFCMFESNENNTTTHIVINEVELNPPEDDRLSTTMEWVELYNPTSNDINLGDWTLSSTQSYGGKTFKISGTITIKANGYYVFGRSRWLHNTKGESVILRDDDGTEIDRTPRKNDDEDDNNSWQRCPNEKDSYSDWDFRPSTKGYSNNCS